MSTRIARPLGRAFLLALAALLIALAPAAPARAHAVLLSTDPVDGAALATAPETVVLTFNEAVRPVAEATLLVDGTGAEQALPAAAGDTEVRIDLPELTDGAYYLNWRVISADSHPIAGVLSFTVGTGIAPAPPPDPAEPAESDRPWALQAANALHYLGLLLFGGYVCFRVAIARELAPPRPRHRLLLASGALAVLAADLAVPLGALDLAGQPPTRLLDVDAWSGTVQSGALVLLAVTAVGLGLAYAVLAKGRRPWNGPVALAAAAVAVTAPLLTGHSMAFGPRWLMLGADALHLATAAIWVGGLAGLAVVLSRPRQGRTGPETAATVVARFSAWAGVTVAVLGASGLAMAWRIHREWAGLFESDHGRALLVKLGLVAVALALASWNRFRLLPLIRSTDARGGLIRLRRIVGAEAATLAAVIALTGVLVNLPPGADQPPSAAPAPAVETPEAVELRADLGEGEAQILVTSGGTGEHTFMLALTDADGLPLEPVEAPVVTAALPERDFGPLQGELHNFEPGRYHCTIDLPLTGDWQLTVQVRLSAFESQTAVFDLAIE